MMIISKSCRLDRAVRAALVMSLCSLLGACGAARPANGPPIEFPAGGSTGPSDADLRALAEKRVEDLLRQYDKNQDGQIEPDEAAITSPELATIDANSDGKLSREELLSFLVKQTRSAIPGFNLPPPLPPASPPPAVGGLEEPFSDNQVRLLVDADEIYPRVYQALHEAKKSIQLDLYLLGGAVGRTIANELIGRQKAGVDVRVMVDPNLGFGGPTQEGMVAVIDYLRQNQIPFKTYPLQYMPHAHGALANKFQIDHNKIIVIDRTRLLIGSMNMFDGAIPNHDIHFDIVGPLAERVAQHLDQQWNLPNNPYIAPPSPRPLRVAAMTVNARVRLTRTDVGGANTKPILLQHIQNARRSIDIAMFEMSDKDVIRALKFAAARGVQIRVLLDTHEDTDKYTSLPVPAGMPNLLPVREFLQARIPVRWFRPARPDQELHMKMAIFDGHTVLEGSTNFTTQALSTFRETGVEIQSTELAAELSRMFERDWNGRSKPILKLSFSQQLVANTIEMLDDSYIGWW